MSAPALEFLALGGLGEFGKNLALYRVGDECLIVDAGSAFPGGRHPGVDRVLPDPRALDDAGTLLGIVATHAHEDHVGAIPWLVERFDLPVWCTAYTRGLLERRAAEHGLDPAPAWRELDPRATIGPFEVEAIPVAHSVPQTRILALRTPAGLALHASDFKLEGTAPGGERTDLERLGRLGDEGVLLLVSDSTNAERPGTTPAEATVEPALERVVAGAAGRVVITTFASNVQRIEAVARVAVRLGRRLALLGSSVEHHVEIARALGLLRLPANLLVANEALQDLAPREALVLAGGSQGEPSSSLYRLAAARHRDLVLEPGDVVVHAARVIPGNEKAVGDVVNRLLRQRVRVTSAEESGAHVSGHAAADELRRLIETVRPRVFLPAHGEFRQLRAHREIAVAAGVAPERALLVENGDVVRVERERAAVVERVPWGHVCLERDGVRVPDRLLRERSLAARDGVLVAVVEIDAHGRLANGYPAIATRGFVPALEDEDAVAEVAQRAVRLAFGERSRDERGDEETVSERVERSVRRALRREFGRRPVVIAVVRPS